MGCVKIILCVVMIFFVTISGGCGGVIKGAVKGASKGAGKVVQKTPRTVKEEVVEQALDIALDSTTGNNSSTNNRPVNSRPTTPRMSSAGKVGAVMTGGAMVANEIMGEDLNSRDLSLGALAIDDPAEKVASEYGRPSQVKTDSDGGKRMIFSDVEVVVKNGKVSALVSQSSTLSTVRGIHEGSSAQEVFARYGTNHSKTTFGDQTLYEYAITSADGHPCLLRFAVNPNGKVAYISERFAQNENVSKNTGGNESDAGQAFINYHKNITNGNYRAAYETLSAAQRDRVGSFDSYAAGFATTISSEVSEINPVSSDEDSCTFDYLLTARDNYRGGVKVQVFRGQVTMAKDKGRWYVRYAASKKISERYE